MTRPIARFRLIPTAGFAIALIASGCTAGASPAPTTRAPAATTPAAASTAPAASGPTMVATGTFHRVDGDASGTVALEHLADGSFAVVFEDFKIDSAAHTDVILVPNSDVTKDADIDKSKILDLGALTGTSGMQDYRVPADMAGNAMSYHTVVLWDTQMTHAIAAAPLASK